MRIELNKTYTIEANENVIRDTLVSMEIHCGVLCDTENLSFMNNRKRNNKGTNEFLDKWIKANNIKTV